MTTESNSRRHLKPIRPGVARLRSRVALACVLALAVTAVSPADDALAVDWSWPEWVEWSGTPQFPANPVYSHSSGVASDPTVIKDGTTYRMVVSGAATPSLIMATSTTEGFSWTTLANGNNGVVLAPAAGKWDANVEQPELIKTASTYRLFYPGYRDVDIDPSGAFWYSDLGMATSTNGTTFTRYTSNPVMRRTPGWYDQDGITDPAIIQVGSTLYMIYTGWCGRTGPIDCPLVPGKDFEATLLTAFSTNNGQTWTKSDPAAPVGEGGLHPDIVKTPDGYYTLFTDVGSEEPAGCPSNQDAVIQARSLSALGPFVASPTNPVICVGGGWEGVGGGFVSVLNDGGVGRLWYTGVADPLSSYKIGLAEMVGA